MSARTVSAGRSLLRRTLPRCSSFRVAHPHTRAFATSSPRHTDTPDPRGVTQYTLNADGSVQHRQIGTRLDVPLTKEQAGEEKRESAGGASPRRVRSVRRGAWSETS